jgi:hypothetical protein
MCTVRLNFSIVWRLQHGKVRQETSFTQDSVFATSVYIKRQIFEDKTVNV